MGFEKIRLAGVISTAHGAAAGGGGRRRVQVVVRQGSCKFEIKFPNNCLSLVLLPQVWVLEEYRVSRNTLATYVFSISRLPGHLELKSWKFSWSPFNSDFKTVLILIPIIKIDQISTLRRKKRKLKTNIFLEKNHL